MTRTIAFLSLILLSTVVFAEISLSEIEQQNILKTVVNYLNSAVDNNNQVTIKDPTDNNERKFQLKGLWNIVNENSDKNEITYSVEVDTDEIGLKNTNKGPTTIYADVKKTLAAWEVIQLRIGSKHLRQTGLGDNFGDSYYYKFE